MGVRRSSHSPLRILIVADGTEGDMRPLLAVGPLLRGWGHAVRACVPENYVSRFISCGIEAVAMSRDSRNFFLNHGEETYGRTFSFDSKYIALFIETVDRQFEMVARYAAQADMILASGFVFGAQSIAELFRLPLVHAVWAPVWFPSEATSPPGVPFAGLPGLLNRVIWRAYITMLDRGMLPSLNAHRADLGLPRLRTVRSHLVANLTLAMDPELAPLPPRYAALGFAQTAYPFLDDQDEIDPQILDFIRQGEAPVYIGFGSMLGTREGRTLEIVVEAARRAGVRALVNAGIAEGSRPELQTRGLMLVGHVPHRKLLPLVAGVVHHGGAGTTHSAGWAGTPQAAVTHLFDHYYMADRTFKLGLGPRSFPFPKLSVRALSEMLVAFTKTPAYRRKAQALARALRARNGAGELAQLVLQRARRLS
ncbi:MAG TPA: glycosyltransferase [Spirochaetia bacterium]|nr:glycosyltransferase [Spirochaetia bacterium]